MDSIDRFERIVSRVIVVVFVVICVLIMSFVRYDQTHPHTTYGVENMEWSEGSFERWECLDNGIGYLVWNVDNR